jgi:1,4-alpha-glucan branching enzyme
MVSKGRTKGVLRFSVKTEQNIREAMLAGDFNNWRPARMTKGKDGAFVAEVPLAQKRCEYKFVLDGQWVPDPDNDRSVRNSYGTLNSVATAE